MSNQPKMHDYSSSQRGGGIGKKSVTITLKRSGAQGEVASETKTITIKRTAALADFAFDAWNPPWELWEVKPVKSEYAEGESVYVKYCVKNIGETAGKASITVKDITTGSTVTTYSLAQLAPNYRFKTSGSHAYVGKMPNRDWRLSFKVDP